MTIKYAIKVKMQFSTGSPIILRERDVIEKIPFLVNYIKRKVSFCSLKITWSHTHNILSIQIGKNRMSASKSQCSSRSHQTLDAFYLNISASGFLLINEKVGLFSNTTRRHWKKRLQNCKLCNRWDDPTEIKCQTSFFQLAEFLQCADFRECIVFVRSKYFQYPSMFSWPSYNAFDPTNANDPANAFNSAYMSMLLGGRRAPQTPPVPRPAQQLQQ